VRLAITATPAKNQIGGQLCQSLGCLRLVGINCDVVALDKADFNELFAERRPTGCGGPGKQWMALPITDMIPSEGSMSK
jgi:hypothetical protein